MGDPRSALPLAWLLAASLLAVPRVWGELAGVEAVPDQTPYVSGEQPVTLLLSKSKYPAEDLHLDAIAWLKARPGTQAEGELQVSVHDEEGGVLSRDRVRPLPGETVFFSVAIPPTMAGRRGSLRVAWTRGDREAGRDEKPFEVLGPSGVATSGRVRLSVPNDGGAICRGVPMTVGVPFPRGALQDAAHVRLMDSEGREVALQTKVTSRWSRFGSVRWLQCDFCLDLAGGPESVWLEYGPDVTRAAVTGLRLSYPDLSFGAPPSIDAGPLRFGENGIEFDAGDGRGHRMVLSPESLSGAFVEHESGARFVMPADTRWEIEEQGPCKAALRRRGWYVLPGTRDRFCRFDTRYFIHYGSPIIRVLHTWVFTGYPYEDLYTWPSARAIALIEGKGDADRIRDMGWRFGPADHLKPDGFLSSLDEGGVWRQGDYLLQHDYDKHEVMAAGEIVTGERAPGIAAATGDGTRMLLGIRDFWQNFPNELEFAEGALLFHQWPRHGRPAGTHPPRVEQGLRLWFAHEGELLDFAVPREYTDDPAFQKANARNYHLHGFRQTINAQGIAKTDEMWLLFSGATTPADESAGALGGLNDGTLRAVVDPEWVAAGGAFYEMHPRDVDKYPEEERIYALHAEAPARWIERLRFYGKWIWGDMWWAARLRERDWSSNWGLYRGFRKSHQGWPYSWIPFARSGDPRFWRLADAATRHMTDVVFCHYSDERVPPWRAGSSEANPVRPRWRGFYLRWHIPWGSYCYDPTSRDYTDKCSYLWHSYYLTGYPRARDVAMDWAQLCRAEGAARWASAADVRTVFTGATDVAAFEASRQSVTMLQSFVEQYQATFDPWFLAAAHQTARNQLRWFREENWKGHFWNPGPREFHRYTGSDEYAEFYLAYARAQADEHWSTAHANWAWNCSNIEPAAYAYNLTRDPFYLGQAAFWLDYARAATYEGEPDYYRGTIVKNEGYNAGPMFTGYYLQHMPYALSAFERAGGRPASVPGAFRYCAAATKTEGKDLHAYRYRLALRKGADGPLPMRLSIQQTLWEPDPEFREEFRYRVTDADGRTVLQGAWDVRVPEAIEVPHTEPAGVYRLQIDGESTFSPLGSWRQIPSLALPISPDGVPEVLELEAGADLGRSHPTSRYWFWVPEGVARFWVEFSAIEYDARDRKNTDLARFSIWGPDGQRVWDEQYSGADRPETGRVRAVVDVLPGDAGRLWRLTVAGLSPGIALDPAIPRAFATSPDRWFEP